jgi:hypothetical protein
LPSWIRIRIRNLNADPDPATQINADPCGSGSETLILTPKKPIKWFLSSKKYDPGCSSRIPDPDADFLPSPIPDPGVKKASDPGSGSATLVYLSFFYISIGFACR